MPREYPLCPFDYQHSTSRDALHVEIASRQWFRHSIPTYVVDIPSLQLCFLNLPLAWSLGSPKWFPGLLPYPILIGISKVNSNSKLRNQGHCGILSFRQYVLSGKRKLWQTADLDPFTSCAPDAFPNSHQVPLAAIVCLFRQWSPQKS